MTASGAPTSRAVRPLIRSIAASSSGAGLPALSSRARRYARSARRDQSESKYRMTQPAANEALSRAIVHLALTGGLLDQRDAANRLLAAALELREIDAHRRPTARVCPAVPSDRVDARLQNA